MISNNITVLATAPPTDFGWNKDKDNNIFLEDLQGLYSCLIDFLRLFVKFSLIALTAPNGKIEDWWLPIPILRHSCTWPMHLSDYIQATSNVVWSFSELFLKTHPILMNLYEMTWGFPFLVSVDNALQDVCLIFLHFSEGVNAFPVRVDLSCFQSWIQQTLSGPIVLYQTRM